MHLVLVSSLFSWTAPPSFALRATGLEESPDKLKELQTGLKEPSLVKLTTIGGKTVQLDLTRKRLIRPQGLFWDYSVITRQGREVVSVYKDARLTLQPNGLKQGPYRQDLLLFNFNTLTADELAAAKSQTADYLRAVTLASRGTFPASGLGRSPAVLIGVLSGTATLYVPIPEPVIAQPGQVQVRSVYRVELKQGDRTLLPPVPDGIRPLIVPSGESPFVVEVIGPKTAWTSSDTTPWLQVAGEIHRRLPVETQAPIRLMKALDSSQLLPILGLKQNQPLSSLLAQPELLNKVVGSNLPVDLVVLFYQPLKSSAGLEEATIAQPSGINQTGVSPLSTQQQPRVASQARVTAAAFPEPPSESTRSSTSPLTGAPTSVTIGAGSLVNGEVAGFRNPMLFRQAVEVIRSLANAGQLGLITRITVSTPARQQSLEVSRGSGQNPEQQIRTALGKLAEAAGLTPTNVVQVGLVGVAGQELWVTLVPSAEGRVLRPQGSVIFQEVVEKGVLSLMGVGQLGQITRITVSTPARQQSLEVSRGSGRNPEQQIRMVLRELAATTGLTPASLVQVERTGVDGREILVTTAPASQPPSGLAQGSPGPAGRLTGTPSSVSLPASKAEVGKPLLFRQAVEGTIVPLARTGRLDRIFVSTPAGEQTLNLAGLSPEQISAALTQKAGVSPASAITSESLVRLDQAGLTGRELRLTLVPEVTTGRGVLLLPPGPVSIENAVPKILELIESGQQVVVEGPATPGSLQPQRIDLQGVRTEEPIRSVLRNLVAPPSGSGSTTSSTVLPGVVQFERTPGGPIRVSAVAANKNAKQPLIVTEQLVLPAEVSVGQATSRILELGRSTQVIRITFLGPERKESELFLRNPNLPELEQELKKGLEGVAQASTARPGYVRVGPAGEAGTIQVTPILTQTAPAARPVAGEPTASAVPEAVWRYGIPKIPVDFILGPRVAGLALLLPKEGVDFRIIVGSPEQYEEVRKLIQQRRDFAGKIIAGFGDLTVGAAISKARYELGGSAIEVEADIFDVKNPNDPAGQITLQRNIAGWLLHYDLEARDLGPDVLDKIIKASFVGRQV